MKELVVISGKGGTGKTSLTASFAALADRPVIADCDVDAADLHLVLAPEVLRRESFMGGRKARIIAGHCVACGKCEELCAFDAIYLDGPGNGGVAKTYRVHALECDGCGVCARYCPVDAIEFKEREAGQWFLARTRFGPLVHARLQPGDGNSGRLVTLVREQARQLATEHNVDLILIDGPPGIGCPVIASLTGVAAALIVTEPTVSGLHDMERALSLTRHFEIAACVCVNRYDINTDMTGAIERRAAEMGARVAGRVRYDPAATQAQVAGKSIVEFARGPLRDDIESVWRFVADTL